MNGPVRRRWIDRFTWADLALIPVLLGAVLQVRRWAFGQSLWLEKR